MASHVSVDYPDQQIHWLRKELNGPGSEPDRRPVGPCPHRLCDHASQSVIGWGPDLTHYELARCEDEDGCDGMCRGWISTEPDPIGTDGPLYRMGPRRWTLMDRPLPPPPRQGLVARLLG